tara:strand:- start:2061 stop:2444 length:384 start_codon:yes stop_codon:yes gene_type:complete
MKIKLTYIVVQSLKRTTHFSSPKFFQIFFTDDNLFPSTYISTKDENETLREISNKYFSCDFGWMKKELAGFRRLNKEECEVVYTCYIPEVLDINKSGYFVPDCNLEKLNIEIEPYYEGLLAGKTRGF